MLLPTLLLRDYYVVGHGYGSWDAAGSTLPSSNCLVNYCRTRYIFGGFGTTKRNFVEFFNLHHKYIYPYVPRCFLLVFSEEERHLLLCEKFLVVHFAALYLSQELPVQFVEMGHSKSSCRSKQTVRSK